MFDFTFGGSKLEIGGSELENCFDQNVDFFKAVLRLTLTCKEESSEWVWFLLNINDLVFLAKHEKLRYFSAKQN